MEHCSFCDIINHNQSAAIVYEDKNVLIFLDKRPLFHGHCLLVPKQHYATLNDLPLEEHPAFFKKLKEINLVVQESMQAEGTFVAMNNKVSQSVPHFHIHVVPRRRGDGLKGFFWPRQTYLNDGERDITLKKLRESWRQLIR